MKNNILLLFSCLFSFNGISQMHTDKQNDYRPKVEINWVKNLKGDFSFTKNWEYPMGVEKKSDGKAGCADGGFCPQRCYGMLDENGMAIKDSSIIFYELLDTTHIPYSIQCEAACGEYAGVNIVHTSTLEDGSIYCFSETGIATHCYLELIIVNSECKPRVILNSIFKNNEDVYEYKSGNISIDKTLFKKGILKAEFDVQFTNLDPNEGAVWWKGKIYSEIKLQ